MPSAIADKLGSTRVTATKLINGLAAAKCVEKQPSPVDKRATRIHLTAASEKRLLTFLPKNFAAIQTILGQLSKADLATLNQLLNKINQGTQNLKNEMES